MINAQSHGPLTAVEAERPVGKTVRFEQFQSQLVDFLNAMSCGLWTDQPGCQLLDSSGLNGLLRTNGFGVLAKFIRSFQILQGCLEQWDERGLDFDAVLIFQVRRQLGCGNIADFREGTSKKFHSVHLHSPESWLELGMYRQAA